MKSLTEKLMQYITDSPTAYHAVAELKEKMQLKGYTQLREADEWKLQPGGKYFVIRNDSSLIAFRTPETWRGGFMITACHSDSPMFKVKENPERKSLGYYTKLAVEPYGGLILSTWLDRPLGLAGRVLLEQGNQICVKLVDFKQDMLIIPNLAIHMNREINNGYVYKNHVDMLPLWSAGGEDKQLKAIVAEELGAKPEQVVSMDLFVYNRTKPTAWGEGKFLSAPRLDDLECAYVAWEAFMQAMPVDNIPVYCLLDNEEVGSSTRQGACSTFLRDTLMRINGCFDNGKESFHRQIAKSFLVSADNAHAVHPNFPEISDEGNRCYLNKGIAVKFQASQKYATDALSHAVFAKICKAAGIEYQTYANRSDMPGGSTLGNLSGNQVPVATVDIGLPQLAMHSSYETAGTKDVDDLMTVLKIYFETVLEPTESGCYVVNCSSIQEKEGKK